jgi:adenylate cyclase
VVIFGAAIAAICITHLASIHGLIALAKLEQTLIDSRFFLRGNLPGSTDCMIVGVNASSLNPSNFEPSDVAASEALQLMQKQWPWNRKVWALLIDKLMAAGAKTVVIDLLFMNNADGDSDLAEALRKYAPHVVIGSVFTLENPESAAPSQIYRTPAPDLLAGTENVTGCTTLPAELDGVIRRAWYWTSELRQYGLDDNSHEIISLAGLGVSKFNPRLSPPDGTHYIDYQGKATTYPYYPIEELFIDRIFTKTVKYQFGNIFRNKIVFVGPIADFFQDTHSTPFGDMPGVEIHAQIAGSILKGTMLRDAPGWLALALTVSMGLAAAVAGLRMAHAVAFGGFLAGGIALFMAAAQLMFVEGRMLIPMAAPLVAFAGEGFFVLVFKFLLEQLERARIRSVLDRYVSRNVAELVLAESDQFEKALRGQRRWVTTLFSDIRGFTTMTEGAVVPENLVEQMNEYFFKMVEAVLAAEGSLHQFVGDAIMAVWGNTHTLDPAAGAYQAVRAALAMRTALAELNATWAGNPARREFRTGIGVNHGEVIVGSLGHPQRMEYTAIGDGINTAARLETATKQFECAILVGEAVEKLTRGRFHYRHLGLVKFKGKSKAIEVYTPLGEAGTPCADWLDGYNGAIELYRRRQFHEAYAGFETARARIGKEDALCEMYLVRCKEYLTNPPPADWDVAWTLTEK